MEHEFLGTGAHHSERDPRTVKHEDLVQFGAPLQKGGVEYTTNDIEHQHSVGICTAISLVQNREKANGKKYSPDFQYLLQKRFVDLNWYEGSSVLSSLKVAKNFGLLPINLWTYTTENDRYLPYNQYIAKLQAIPDSEIQRLLLLCTDKIQGYAQVNVSDPQAIAKAVNESKSGILCRYDCGSTWWIPSWLAKDINPLRKPDPATSGHAIILNMFDYTKGFMQKLANTWGITWCLNGCADINWSNYKMTEAWTILDFSPPINPYPTVRLGSKGVVVKDLQIKLNKKVGCNLPTTGNFGPLTLAQVINFQKMNKLVPDGIVGPLTWGKLNL